MKKHLLFLFAALLPLVANAEKVEIDGIWYNLVSKAKQAEVTFKGNYYYSHENEYSGSINIPATVTHNGVEYSVTSIGSSAFYWCSSLTAITIPEGVTSIGNSAFADCSSLTAVTIPEGVTSIGESAFSACISLTSIIIPEGVTSIGGDAFAYCNSLAAITIPEGVTSIGRSAFYGCTSLTAITLPEGVTSIGERAFAGCSSLTAITLPESLTSIGMFAFDGCSSLTAINIPKSVTSIGGWAFWGCRSLTAITCHAVTPPTINSNTFEDVDKGIPVYVPAGSVEAYKEAKYWSEFTNYVGIEAGIDKSQLTTGSEQLTIYDLRGRRVTDTERGGIYIVGGKKVIIK